jgi:hypothetical protein
VLNSMEVNYHTRGPDRFHRGTAVTVHGRSLAVCVAIGPGGGEPELRIYVDRPGEAFALAQAFAAAGRLLEERAGTSRATEMPSEPWEEVPLPLDADLGGIGCGRAAMRS